VGRVTKSAAPRPASARATKLATRKSRAIQAEAPVGRTPRLARAGASAKRMRSRPAHAAATTRPARCAVLTVSDTRKRANDPGGDSVQSRIERAGHRVVLRAWSRDDVRSIRAAARAALADSRIDALVVTGGTGPAPRDVTPEALAPLIARAFAGFGELFRALSYAEIGSAAWLSRAGAGVARGRLVFWLPGSPPGARLALDLLILPELGHALRLLGRIPH